MCVAIGATIVAPYVHICSHMFAYIYTLTFNWRYNCSAARDCAVMRLCWALLLQLIYVCMYVSV